MDNEVQQDTTTQGVQASLTILNVRLELETKVRLQVFGPVSTLANTRSKRGYGSEDSFSARISVSDLALMALRTHSVTAPSEDRSQDEIIGTTEFLHALNAPALSGNAGNFM